MPETATSPPAPDSDPIAEMVNAVHAAVHSRDPVVHALPTLLAPVPAGDAMVWISRFVRPEAKDADGFDLIAALAAENLRRASGAPVPVGAALARLGNRRMGEILIGRLTGSSLNSLSYELSSAVAAATAERIAVDFHRLAPQIIWAYRKPADYHSWKRTVRTWASDYHRLRTPR